jgi:hypothetical protein
MSKQILFLFLPEGDNDRAKRILASFADRTGLVAETAAGGTCFPLGPDDHRVKVIQTLTAIDPQWTQHLALGDPAAGAGESPSLGRYPDAGGY